MRMIAGGLVAGLAAPEAAERRAAAEEIGESGAPEALALLIGQLRQESSRAVKEAILREVSEIRLAGTDAAILELLRDQDPFVRAEAAAMLQHRAGDTVESLKNLTSLLRSGDRDLRKFAIEILGQAAIALPDPFYEEALQDDDINVVICAIERIGSARRTALAGPVLAIALGHGHPMVLCACLDTLALIGLPETLDALREKFPDAAEVPELFLPPFLKLFGRTAGPDGVDEICRAIAARGASACQPSIDALTRITARHQLTRLNSSCEETLCGLLGADLDGPLRFYLIRLLGHFAESPRVAQAILPCLQSSDASLRLLAAESLAKSADPAVDAALRSLLANESDPEMHEELEELLGRRPRWNLPPNSSPN
jgi:HEAT repeat protein